MLFQNIHSKGFKVTIDGQGADEVFGGYAQILYYYIILRNLFNFFLRYLKYINTYKNFSGGSLSINNNFFYLLFQNLKYIIF